MKIAFTQLFFCSFRKAVSSFPSNAQVWFDFLAVRLQMGGKNARVLKDVKKDFENCFRALGSSDEGVSRVRSLYVRFLLSQVRVDDSELLEQVSKIPLQEERENVCAFCWSAVSKVWPEDRLRAFYGAMLAQTGCVSSSLLLSCAEWEQDGSRKRALFEECVTRYGHCSEEAWLSYAQFFTDANDLNAAGAVHWRARKALVGEHLTNYLERATIGGGN